VTTAPDLGYTEPVLQTTPPDQASTPASRARFSDF
jgi:hypothetical protein